jgi:hypothetical protein
MIAGARELMTPGAWVRVGTTYQLSATGGSDSQLRAARRRALEALREQLWAYARTHDDTLPPHEFVPEIPEEAWKTLDPTGARFVYFGGYRLGDPGVVAVEPRGMGSPRLALMANGVVTDVDTLQASQR